MATGSLSQPFDLSEAVVGMAHTGAATMVEWTVGPPPRLDGYSVSAPHMTRNAPHNGELHPDGDELLYVVSGHVHVVLEEADGERVVSVTGGQAFIVPQGIWHRVQLQEPTHLVHVTPGPWSDHRPLAP